MSKKKTGPAKRFGTRYGRTTREKVGAIESELRKNHKCPYCNFEKVKRVSVGIWACSKCGAKFTGRAYKPTIKKVKTEISKKKYEEVIEKRVIDKKLEEDYSEENLEEEFDEDTEEDYDEDLEEEDYSEEDLEDSEKESTKKKAEDQ